MSSEKKSKKPLPYLAEDALKEAVHEAIADHARTGDKVVVNQNGKAVEVSAKQLLRKTKR